MKISILVIGKDRQSAEDFAELTYKMLPKQLIPVDGVSPEFEMITTVIEKVETTIKCGEERPPESFMEADFRLMVASDSKANHFLCQMSEAMTQAYLGEEVKIQQIPNIITHAMAINIVMKVCLLFDIQCFGMDPVEMLRYAIVIWVARVATTGSRSLF